MFRQIYCFKIEDTSDDLTPILDYDGAKLFTKHHAERLLALIRETREIFNLEFSPKLYESYEPTSSDWPEETFAYLFAMHEPGGYYGCFQDYTCLSLCSLRHLAWRLGCLRWLQQHDLENNFITPKEDN